VTARRRTPLWVGTAGWSLPRADQHRFPGEGSHLERYARVLNAAEINSTFHRPHRASTFERWAESVPRSFRFSVKLPRSITHDRRLAGTSKLLEAFLVDIQPLAANVGCLLVQLPPSLEFDPRVAAAFFGAARKRFEGPIALEPRHASWFMEKPEALLASHGITRVIADPLRSPAGAEPGGWTGMAYFRLHGSPRVYYSSYAESFLQTLAERLLALQRARIPVWCIFDNTTLGAGTANALDLIERLRASR
jgi:uncharacterized protein YecE (DUF72 family)